MKKLKIGKKEYSLCESVNDLYDIRFPIFLNFLRMSIEDIDKPLFASKQQKADEWLNKAMPYNAVKEYLDYGSSINLEQVNTTGLSMCFALICLDNGEDQSNTDESFLKEKLDKMRKNGLKRGIVEEQVSSFIKASPDSFGEYNLIAELMQETKDFSL
jgi:hypothetical protein